MADPTGYDVSYSFAGFQANNPTTPLAGVFVNTSGSQSGVHTADIRINMTSGIQQNIAAMSLVGGDWEVNGQLLKGAGASTTITFIAGNLATVSAGVDRTFGRRVSFQHGGAVFGATEFTVFNFSQVRFLLAGATTIYLVGDDNFGVSTMVNSGWLNARRPR